MANTTNTIFFKNMRRYHNYYSRTGFYGFLLKNIFKILAILTAIVFIFLGLEKWVLDFDQIFSNLFHNLNYITVLAIFITSESVFGLIPPDLFIIWARNFEHQWAIVSLLAALSYIGGLISYFIGTRLRRIPKLNTFVAKKLDSHFKQVKRWGAVFILVAAIFPVPYSIACMVSGVLKFPVKLFFILGIARIARFFSYAAVLYGLINL